MGEGKSLVPISPQELIRVCEQCLSVIEGYKSKDDIEHVYKAFSWTKLKYIEKSYYQPPPWSYRGAGIKTRLLGLVEVARNVIEDEGNRIGSLFEPPIMLTETSYSNLYKLLNKDDSFEPFIFGLGY